MNKGPANRIPSHLAARWERRGRRGLGLVLLAMIALNGAGVAGRYGWGAAIYGADEILVYAMVWLVFLGAVLAAVGGQHLGFPGLMQALPARARHWLSVFVDLASAGLLAFIAVQSWQVIEKLDRIGQTSMAAGIPMTVPHAAVLVSFALIAVVLAVRGLSRAAGTFSHRSLPQ